MLIFGELVVKFFLIGDVEGYGEIFTEDVLDEEDIFQDL